MEDVDTPRCLPGGAELTLSQLAACGLLSDERPWVQSQRGAAYASALQQLRAAGRAYPCGCTRRDINAAQPQPHQRFGERIYPGTCRDGLRGKPERAVRLRAEGTVRWQDRRLGAQQQDLATEVGDFVLRRADGLWAYQLAVVVDDAAQGITHVVRGQDLADNTARQIMLQRALGETTPAYLHTPLVLAGDGHKLSKQNGALALDVARPVAALQVAAAALGLPTLHAATPAEWLVQAVPAWAGIIRAFAQPDTAKETLS